MSHRRKKRALRGNGPACNPWQGTTPAERDREIAGYPAKRKAKR